MSLYNYFKVTKRAAPEEDESPRPSPRPAKKPITVISDSEDDKPLRPAPRGVSRSAPIVLHSEDDDKPLLPARRPAAAVPQDSEDDEPVRPASRRARRHAHRSARAVLDGSEDDDKPLLSARSPAAAVPRDSESKKVDVKVDSSNRGERDWVIDPDFFVSADTDPFDGEEDSTFGADSIQTAFVSRPVRVQFPRRFLAQLDERFGETVFNNTTMRSSDGAAVAMFKDRVRRIIGHLQEMARTQRDSHRDEDKPRLFTRGFENLLCRASEDFLVESFMDGVPKVTQIVLGQEKFTVEDILQLPRLTDSELSEKSVYVDALEYTDDEKYDWRLYVGSAVGQFGCLQRWHDYTSKRNEPTTHGKALRQPGRTIHLRSLAHYGFEPEPWLPILAEGVFMLYIGTIHNPAWRDPKYDWFVNDGLYAAESELRSACELPERLNKGLNVTWTFCQGWRGVGIKSGAKCVNCQRVVPPLESDLFKRHGWTYADSTRPAADQVLCLNCVYFKRHNGFERPAVWEERRPFRKTIEYRPRENPGFCEVTGGCQENYDEWTYNGRHQRFYCHFHNHRANSGVDMLKPKMAISQREYPMTELCEWAKCSYSANEWSGKVDPPRYLCERHAGRAGNNQPMDAPWVVRATKRVTASPKPADGRCMWVSQDGRKKHCDRTADKWMGRDVKLWLCGSHESRKAKGRPMDDPMNPVFVKKNPKTKK